MDFIQPEAICCFKSVVVPDLFPLQVTRDNIWRMTKRSCVAVPPDPRLQIPLPGIGSREFALSFEYFRPKIKSTAVTTLSMECVKINLCSCSNGNDYILKDETTAGKRKWSKRMKQWLCRSFNSTLRPHISPSDMTWIPIQFRKCFRKNIINTCIGQI
jgi:hypothetical protein